MEKLYLKKAERKILERSMPKHIRNLYKKGNFVADVQIVRSRPLKGYGTLIHLEIEKSGKFVCHDLPYSDKKVVDEILGYFLHGEQGKPGYYLGKPYVECGDFAIYC